MCLAVSCFRLEVLMAYCCVATLDEFKHARIMLNLCDAFAFTELSEMRIWRIVAWNMSVLSHPSGRSPGKSTYVPIIPVITVMA